MNRIFLIGNLTRDPEPAETNGGVSVCRFSIAVNRNYTGSDGERQTDFFNVTAWRGLAESVAQHCKKGNKVAVTGSIQMRTYEGNDGVTRLAVDVIAQEVEFLTQKKQEDQEYEPRKSSPARNGYGAQSRRPTFDDDGDIPF